MAIELHVDIEPIYICIHTYLHKAEASVSNEDRPHGTTAHTCCTGASSGTNYKDRQKDKLHRAVTTELTLEHTCRKLFIQNLCFVHYTV